MNKIYKIVWSKVKNTYVVVSEVAKSHSKAVSSRQRKSIAAVMAVLALGFIPGGAYAALDGVKTFVEPGNQNVQIGNGTSLENNEGKNGAVAIGDHAKINDYVMQEGSIAIGKNAFVENMYGNQEKIFKFNQQDLTKWASSIAIGQNAYARSGSTMIGDHKYIGKLGDTDVDGSDVQKVRSKDININATTIGANSYNQGAFSSVLGTYSIISGKYNGSRFSTYGMQNMGASIVGSLNSIESASSSSNLSGIANSVVGVANRTNNANGALIFGAGNEIENSIGTLSGITGGGASAKDLADKLRNTVKSSNGGGAVLAIGGGNKANYAKASQLMGVNNTLTGAENAASDYNLLNGFKNVGTNISHVSVIGSENQVTDTKNALVFGDKRKLTGADGSIVLGSADESAETNVKDATVIGHNANTTVASGVALGSGSVADRAGFTEEKKGVFSDVDLNGKTAAAVSVGTKDKLRQIINVGDATEDTDAVNLRQLKALSTKVDKGGVHYFSVKSKDPMPNYKNDGAQGEGSVAIGPGSTSKFNEGVTVGANNKNEGYFTTVIGSENKAYGLERSYEYAYGATIVGTGNTIMSNNGTIAMGSGNIVHRGIAIGEGNAAMGENAVALGNQSSAMYTDTVGIGFGTHGEADGVVAIGRAATGDALAGVAIGRYAEVHATTGVALGESSISSRGAGFVGYMPGAVGQTAEEVAAYLGKAEEYKSWKADVEKNKDAYDRAKAWHAAADAERQAYNEVNQARIAYAKKSTEENKKAITEKYDAWKKAADERQKTDVAMRADNDYKTIRDLNARYGQIFGKLMSTEGAVSVGDEKTGRTRQIINVSAGTKDTDAVNVYQLKALATAPMNFYFGGKKENNVYTPGTTNWSMPLNEFRMDFGDGLKAEQVTDKDGKKYTLVKMSDEITIGKDGKDGKIGINGKDGTSAEITVGKGEPGVDGKDGVTRIIYKDKGGKNHEVATLDDGLKFKGDNDDVVIRKLNTQLDIKGGAKAADLSDGNIGVVGTAGDNGGLTVKLSKKLKDLTSAEFKDGDNITNITGGNVTITRKEGTVNLWELNQTVNNIKQGTTDVSSWKLQANGTNERIIKKDSIVNFKNGANTEVTVTGNDVTVDLNADTKKQISDNTTNITNIDKRVTSIEKNIDQKIEGSKIKVEGDATTGVKATEVTDGDKVTGYKVSLEQKVKVGNVTIDGTDKKGEITGLTNKTLDSDDFATKGRAATEEQLKAAMDKAVAQGTTTVKAGDQNISVVKTENKNEYTVKLAKDITVDSVTAKTVKADEYKVGDKTYINKDGINANGKKITGVAPGEISKDSKDAVNGSQLFATNQQIFNNMNQINSLREESREGDALGAAMAALKPLDFDPYQRSQVMAGVGYYRGKEAIALGLAYYSNENTLLHAGLSYAGSSELMANAGISYRFGSRHDRKLLEERNKLMPQYKDGVISSVYVMQDEMTKLQKENEILKEKNAKAEAENKEMRSELEILKKQVSKLMEKI